MLLAEVRKLALQADLGVEPGGEERTISERLAQLRRLRSVATASPHGSVGSPPTALPVDEIEAYFAKGDVLLLEYFLGEEQSYVWAVGGGRVEVHELAPEPAIEERIRRAFALLTARQVESPGSLREQALRSRESDERFYREALSLSRELLGSVPDIDRFSRLVVVSDGALNYFPIGVLPHPQRSGEEAETYVPLITTHEVVRAPSVTSMLAIAFRAQGRSAKSPIAILADPVFTADDPRVGVAERAAVGKPPGALSAMEANLRGSGRTLASLPRLLASREELSAIANIAPQAATTATDFMADRATAQRLLRGSYRVVHFATHGVLNDRYPELSGIVLSLVDD
ncbi:MAG: CHAT domain-containing protein, partial [Vicinamibacteria bacterium]